MSALDERLVSVRPTARQLAIQEMEFYAFVHFGVNTFTDREWGDGTESPGLFNPAKLDAEQWVSALKAAGMKGLILTCKHHDGFCLWPSGQTDHTVAASPFGRDVVAEVSRACRKGGIRFGIYLSPWDRHEPRYGSGKPYDDYFIAQLEELLTGYGEVFCVWLDGACGEGPNGKTQRYDWDGYYETIRRLQPNACINVCGPDVRWCGNEAGETRDAEWSVVPLRTRDTEKVADASQKADEAGFRARPIRAQDRDLGSRTRLAEERELVWYPAEVDTSIRPGWFWHEAEDDKVKPLDQLIDIYEKSVGGNAMMLLNIPPNRDGLFHANDVQRLRELGSYLRSAYGSNLVDDRTRIEATPAAPGCGIDYIRGEDEGYYMPAEEDGTAKIVLKWEKPQTARRLVMKEQLKLSQRVEGYEVDLLDADGSWRTAARGSVIGYKRIVRLEGRPTRGLRIRITDARVAPTLKFVGVYG